MPNKQNINFVSPLFMETSKAYRTISILIELNLDKATTAETRTLQNSMFSFIGNNKSFSPQVIICLASSIPSYFNYLRFNFRSELFLTEYISSFLISH
jgi:hypothetical protein